MTEYDEKELIKRAVSGDERSFEALFLHSRDKAYSLCYRYLLDPDDACDALQESFINVYKALPRFNMQSKFETWLYRIVINCCNDLLRKKKKLIYLDSFEEGEKEALAGESKDAAERPEKALEDKELSENIRRCLEAMSPLNRQMIVLRDAEGFSYDDIAEMLGCSVGTVKSRISRARENFREKYKALD